MRTPIMTLEGYGSFVMDAAAPGGQDSIANAAARAPGVTYNEGNGEADTIMMQGPLGDVYTKALSIYFTKTPLDNVLVQETQAMDAAYKTAVVADSVDLGLKEIADAVHLVTPGDSILGNVSATVFAVDQTMMNRPEVIDAVEKLRDRAAAQGIDYVMAVNVEPLKEMNSVCMDSNSVYYGIHDHTINAENAGKVFNRATECYCAQQGMNVVFGMEGFAIWLMDKYKGKVNYAQEGFSGFLLGFFGSGVVGIPGLSTAVGATVKSSLESKKREIEKVADEIAKIREHGAKAALDEGRITNGQYKTESRMDGGDIIKGAILGTLPVIGSFYNGVVTSKLQNRTNELKKLLKELNKLMVDNGIKGKRSKDDDGDHEYR